MGFSLIFYLKLTLPHGNVCTVYNLYQKCRLHMPTLKLWCHKVANSQTFELNITIKSLVWGPVKITVSINTDIWYLMIDSRYLIIDSQYLIHNMDKLSISFISDRKIQNSLQTIYWTMVQFLKLVVLSSTLTIIETKLSVHYNHNHRFPNLWA